MTASSDAPAEVPPGGESGRLRYELTARVPSAERPEFDRWLSGTVLDWATHDAVSGFRSWRGVDGDGVLLRLTFTFPSRAAWERFVGGAHRERLARVEEFADEVDVSLWAPAAVSVHTGEEALRPLVGEGDQAGVELE